jgi:hypothetical protein
MFDWDMLWAAGVAALATVLWLVWQRRWAGGSPAILNGSDDPPVWPVLATGIMLYLDDEAKRRRCRVHLFLRLSCRSPLAGRCCSGR